MDKNYVPIAWCFSVLIRCHIISGVRDPFCPTWVGSPDTLAFTSDDGSMCYIFDDRHVTWHEANSSCSDAGWRLLKIPSQQLQLFFEREYENISQNIGTTLPCFWIGLSDHQREGDFLWTDGSPMGYNLIVRQSTLLAYALDCVAFCRKIIGSGFEWRVKYCSGDDIFGFVCEAVSLKITTTTASETRSALFPRTDRSKRTQHREDPTTPPTNAAISQASTEPDIHPKQKPTTPRNQASISQASTEPSIHLKQNPTTPPTNAAISQASTEPNIHPKQKPTTPPNHAAISQASTQPRFHLKQTVRDPFCPTWVGSPDTLAFTSDDGSMCYIFDDRHVTWHQANSSCSDAGWRLLKIPSRQVELFFERKYENISQNIGTTLPCFWIGLSDHQKEGDFLWTDGSPMGYNLIVRQSVILLTYFSDCVAFCRKIIGSGFEWPVKICSGGDILGFVCEADPTTPPTNAEISQASTEPNIHPKQKPTTPRNHASLSQASTEPSIHLKQKYNPIVTKDKKNYRVTSAPEWSIRAHTATGCWRECRSHQKECLAFNYNSQTLQCRGFRSLSLDGVCNHGWTLWKIMWGTV